MSDLIQCATCGADIALSNDRRWLDTRASPFCGAGYEPNARHQPKCPDGPHGTRMVGNVTGDPYLRCTVCGNEYDYPTPNVNRDALNDRAGG